MLKLITLAAICIIGAFAQSYPPNNTITPVSTAPSGACSANLGQLVAPGGSIYTCQNNVWAQIGTGTVTGVTGTAPITATGTTSVTIACPTCAVTNAANTFSGTQTITGPGATSGTNALVVNNSSSTNLFTVRDDGNVGIGTMSPGASLDIPQGTLAGSDVPAFRSTTTWNNASIAFHAFQINITNIASGGSSRPFQINSGGNEIISVNSAGVLILQSGINVSNDGTLTATGDGLWTFASNNGTTFNRLGFGPQNSSFPALKQTGGALQVIANDGSSNANFLVTGNVGIGSTAPGSLLTVKGGDVNVTSASFGLVLKDTSNGNCYRVQSTAGVLVPTSITCPTN